MAGSRSASIVAMALQASEAQSAKISTYCPNILPKLPTSPPIQKVKSTLGPSSRVRQTVLQAIEDSSTCDNQRQLPSFSQHVHVYEIFSPEMEVVEIDVSEQPEFQGYANFPIIETGKKNSLPEPASNNVETSIHISKLDETLLGLFEKNVLINSHISQNGDHIIEISMPEIAVDNVQSDVISTCEDPNLGCPITELDSFVNTTPPRSVTNKVFKRKKQPKTNPPRASQNTESAANDGHSSNNTTYENPIPSCFGDAVGTIREGTQSLPGPQIQRHTNRSKRKKHTQIDTTAALQSATSSMISGGNTRGIKQTFTFSDSKDDRLTNSDHKDYIPHGRQQNEQPEYSDEDEATHSTPARKIKSTKGR